jgi:choline dehydrogenase
MNTDNAYDYVVVGSGAGGGPLAANLARSGFRVLLLEAGGDPCSETELGKYLYEVPIFHGLSTEYKECAWDYFVRHYTETEQQKKDSKYVPEKDGVWYPRAGALGGCTTHNAMITVVPQDSDWNYIADLTGDESWRADKMRAHFVRLENCKYVPNPHSLKGIAEGVVSSIAELIEHREDWRDWAHGHGFDGWLPTCEADPKLVLKDPELILLLLKAVRQALDTHTGNPFIRTLTRFDPNDLRNAEVSPEGLSFTPLAVENGKRMGPREFLLRVKKEHPENLTIQMQSLATRVLFAGTKAIGVEYMEGRHLYGADPGQVVDPSTAPRKQVMASREVILCGGAFNSPQLLMLSGVGPKADLEALHIPIVADLSGVGKNLQDRYEVGVVSDFVGEFALLSGAMFEPPGMDGGLPDVDFAQWVKGGNGVYASNGSLIGIIKRSTPDKKDPDLYIFGLPGFFKGYFPGYSKVFERFHNRFTWAILKARTNNTAGQVSLKSANPWDTPRIEFHYFNEGNDAKGEDLDAVVKGVEFVRAMNQHLKQWGLIKEEELPGADKTGDELRAFIRDEAWGHHASCTNKIGTDDDPMAVLDSGFRVRKTQNLRVVDASVFPKIPGYFIVAAVYMISEKAFETIVADSKKGNLNSAN